MKNTESYVEKVKEILDKSECLDGYINRMCVTSNCEELMKMYSFLTLCAAEFYHLNRERLFIKEHSDAEPPVVKL